MTSPPFEVWLKVGFWLMVTCWVIWLTSGLINLAVAIWRAL